MIRIVVALVAALVVFPVAAHDMGAMEGGAASEGTMMVSGAMIAAAPGSNAAAYAEIMNMGGEADRLIAVKSDVAAAVELHEMTSENGVMQMRPVDGVDIPAGATVALSSGGTHIMLIGLKAPLAVGASADLTFVFAKAGEMKIAVPVMKMDADDMSGHDMH